MYPARSLKTNVAKQILMNGQIRRQIQTQMQTSGRDSEWRQLRVSFGFICLSHEISLRVPQTLPEPFLTLKANLPPNHFLSMSHKSR